MGGSPRGDGTGHEEDRRALVEVVDGLVRAGGRLAADLHDGPVQRLTAATMLLDVLRMDRPSAEADRVSDVLRAAVEELRAVLDTLPPDPGEAGGLGRAVAALLDRHGVVPEDVLAEAPVNDPGSPHEVTCRAVIAVLSTLLPGVRRTTSVALRGEDDELVIDLEGGLAPTSPAARRGRALAELYGGALRAGPDRVRLRLPLEPGEGGRGADPGEGGRGADPGEGGRGADP